MRLRTVALIAALFGLATLPGCGAGFGAPAAGVTTGGAQDLGLARNQVAAGHLPAPEAFVVEGLLSEHDIDVGAPPCARELCLHPAVGVAPALDTGREAAFMVLGMSSGIDLRTFRRAPLNVSVVVDRSGSMTGDKIVGARQAVHRLIETLGPDDLLSIVAFDDRVDVLAEAQPVGARRASLHRAVRRLDARGSTDIESALAEGYELVHDASNEARQDRVILITDARPNTGRTSEGEFLELTRAWADRGVGLTVMGVGLDFGQDLSLAISAIPGANYLYLETADKLAKVFDEDFDLLVAPVAWDFELVVEPAPGYRIAAAYGVPSWVDDEGRGAVRVHIPTLFLSRNRGAVVLRLEPLDGPVTGDLAGAGLSYRRSRGSAPLERRAVVEVPEMPAPAGVQKAVALVNAALGLQEAVRRARAGDPDGALALIEEVDRLTAGHALTGERRLADDLAEVIRRRAPYPREEHPSRAKRWIR